MKRELAKIWTVSFVGGMTMYVDAMLFKLLNGRAYYIVPLLFLFTLFTFWALDKVVNG